MTTRRTFIKQCSTAIGAASIAGAPSLALGAGKQTATVKSTQRGAFQNVPKQYPLSPLTVEGQWPTSLNGKLYRNSPAMLTREGFQHKHMFDGDGMVQQYRIEQGKVSHQAQMVMTEKYLNEEAAGRFLYPVTGSTPPSPHPTRTNDTANPANISVRKMGDRMFALWEAGSAYEIDPDSLETLGRADWNEELQHVPFSAHPLMDANGDWWNIGSWVYDGSARVIVYQLNPQGNLKRVKVIRLNQSGYMHAFCLSQNYLILVNTAHTYKRGNHFLDSFQFQSNGHTEIVLVNKNTLEIARTIEVPANFVFHFGNAYEQGNELVLNMAEYENADIMSEGLSLGEASAYSESPTTYRSNLSEYRINLQNGAWKKTATGLDLEFPNYQEDKPFHRQTLFGCGQSSKKTGEQVLTSYNPNNGKIQHSSLGKSVVIEEPLLIRDSKQQEFVIHSFADREKKRSGVALYQAEKIEAGPIAMAHADTQFPIGFHGCFVPS